MKRILIAWVGMLLAVSFSITAGARQISTSARCESGADCNIGDGKPTGITLDTDGADLNLEGTTTNTLTLTAATTGTAVFTGADAAGAANTTYTTTGTGTTTLDTGGASAIVIGSADVTDVTINSNTGITFADGGDSINNTVDDTFDFVRDDSGDVTIAASDGADANTSLILTSSGTGDVTLTPDGAGATIIGDAANTGTTIISTGGTVTVDGFVQAQVKVVSQTAGAITINAVTIATAAGDYTIADDLCALTADIGNWFTIIIEDASTVVIVDPLDTVDQLFIDGIGIDAGHEAESNSTADFAGAHLTMVCMAVNQWYSTSATRDLDGTVFWIDGGAS